MDETAEMGGMEAWENLKEMMEKTEEMQLSQPKEMMAEVFNSLIKVW